MRLRSSPKINEPLRILIVRPRLIGDVLLTTPIVRALRRRFPAAELIYVVETAAAPVVQANPHLTETIVIRHRRGWRRILEDVRLGLRFAARRIDIALDLHGGPRSGWLTFASHAPMRVGYDGSGRRWMYTHLLPRPRGYAPRHSVLNQWDLLAPVDPAFADPPTPDRDRLEMPASPAARAAVTGHLRARGVTDDDQVVVIHAGAGNEFRRWPAESFAEVAATLAGDRDGRAVVVVGSLSDWTALDAVVRRARDANANPRSRIVGAPGWPLAEVRALMDRAVLFIGGDSGPMHVAAASDVPIVAIFGPTLPAAWAPWRPAGLPVVMIEPGPLECRPCDQRVCAPGDFRCLRSTTAATVVAAARRLLESRP